MDPKLKETLDLIEAMCETIPVSGRGPQLLQVAKDYVEDADLAYARTVLCKIDPSYFLTTLPLQLPLDAGLRESLAIVVEAFGADFYLWLRPVSRS